MKENEDVYALEIFMLLIAVFLYGSALMIFSLYIRFNVEDYNLLGFVLCLLGAVISFFGELGLYRTGRLKWNSIYTKKAD